MLSVPKNKIIWLTGQPGSGKSELGRMLYNKYVSSFPTVLIDGDDLREKTGNFDYTKEGRYKNVTNAQLLARYLYKSGYVVIVALVAPYRDIRDVLKKEIGGLRYHEVYLHYQDVIRGKEEYHVLDYEPPLDKFLSLDTTTDTPKESLKKIVNYVKEQESLLEII